MHIRNVKHGLAAAALVALSQACMMTVSESGGSGERHRKGQFKKNLRTKLKKKRKSRRQ